jgi:hypothetical protein
MTICAFWTCAENEIELTTPKDPKRRGRPKRVMIVDTDDTPVDSDAEPATKDGDNALVGQTGADAPTEINGACSTPRSLTMQPIPRRTQLAVQPAHKGYRVVSDPQDFFPKESLSS